MKAYLFSFWILASISSVSAQNFSPKKPDQPVNRAVPPALKDSVVVDISDSAIADDFEAKDAPPASDAPKIEPLKEIAPLAKKNVVATESPSPPLASGDAEPQPEGVVVRVEPGKSGAAMDSSKIKLLAPFPAKALAKAPAGWRLEHPDDVPPLVKEVVLDNGARLNLSIRPHVLVPDSDGRQVIAVNEPGYDPALEYAQAKTMGAILSDSIERMDKDSKDLGDALERLQQLLGSLPHAAAPAPSAKPTIPGR